MYLNIPFEIMLLTHWQTWTHSLTCSQTLAFTLYTPSLTPPQCIDNTIHEEGLDDYEFNSMGLNALLLVAFWCCVNMMPRANQTKLNCGTCWRRNSMSPNPSESLKCKASLRKNQHDSSACFLWDLYLIWPMHHQEPKPQHSTKSNFFLHN